MDEVKDQYYALPQISNSDLSDLKRLFEPEEVIYDKEKAYSFGTLIDCMITEPFKVNYFKHTCAGRIYTAEDFALAEAMKASFYRDEYCRLMANYSEYQKVSVRHSFPIEHDGIRFSLDVRCKWDLFAKPRLGLSGDIKSTTATTHKQFVAACDYFSYWRQRAWYMDIEECDKDMLIGISKVNHQVFKVPITRDGEFYKKGKAEYQDLAFKYWYLFGNQKAA